MIMFSIMMVVVMKMMMSMNMMICCCCCNKYRDHNDPLPTPVALEMPGIVSREPSRDQTLLAIISIMQGKRLQELIILSTYVVAGSNERLLIAPASSQIF